MTRSWRGLRLSPAQAHPLVRRLFEEMDRQKLGPATVADRSGLNRNTLAHWRTRTTPRVADLEACLNVVGLELVVRSIR